MNDYNTILLAVDLSDEAEQLTGKAKSLARTNNATLHVIHVIEPPTYAYGGDIPIVGLNDIENHARVQMTKFADRNGIPLSHQHVVLGRPAGQIHATAKKLNADLVVIGSHGRHGLALLLGSTANGVLHGANCDVLAVRVNSD